MPSRNRLDTLGAPGTGNAIDRHSSQIVINKYKNLNSINNTVTHDDDYESNLRLKSNHSAIMNTRPASNPKNRRLEPLPPQPNKELNTIQLNTKTQKMVYPLNRRNIEILENMNNGKSILQASPGHPVAQKSLNYLESQSQRILINSNPAEGPNPLSGNDPALYDSAEDRAGASQMSHKYQNIAGMSSGPLSLHNDNAMET